VRRSWPAIGVIAVIVGLTVDFPQVIRMLTGGERGGVSAPEVRFFFDGERPLAELRRELRIGEKLRITARGDKAPHQYLLTIHGDGSARAHDLDPSLSPMKADGTREVEWQLDGPPTCETVLALFSASPIGLEVLAAEITRSGVQPRLVPAAYYEWSTKGLTVRSTARTVVVVDEPPELAWARGIHAKLLGLGGLAFAGCTVPCVAR
jgi:hypothetical protein